MRIVPSHLFFKDHEEDQNRSKERVEELQKEKVIAIEREARLKNDIESLQQQLSDCQKELEAFQEVAALKDKTILELKVVIDYYFHDFLNFH